MIKLQHVLDYTGLVGKKVLCNTDRFEPYVHKGDEGVIIDDYPPFGESYKDYPGMRGLTIKWDRTDMEDGFSPHEIKYLEFLEPLHIGELFNFGLLLNRKVSHRTFGVGNINHVEVEPHTTNYASVKLSVLYPDGATRIYPPTLWHTLTLIKSTEGH